MMRRFGVELELIAPQAGSGNALAYAANIVNGLGITARVAGHLGSNYAIWQCKHDGTIRPQPRGVEVVSRIMPANPDSYAEVMRVATRLDSDGFAVNRTCGLHVHINVSDLPMRTRQLIVLRYTESQADYDRMLPASRRVGANDYCRANTDRAGLEAAINSGSSAWRRGEGRHYENVNTAFMHDTDARLEFRQGAGSCDGEKIVAWVKYLQEMIQEVADRAASSNFAAAPRGMSTAPVRPVAPSLGVPRMHANSDATRALTELCAHGVVTTAWAAQNGIVGPVLRRIIVGFRRHGAGLRTVSASGGPEYHLVGVTVPCTAQAIFAPVVAAPVAPVAPPVAPSPVPGPATITAAAFVRYDFFAGLSEATAAWVRSRRDTFASELPATSI